MFIVIALLVCLVSANGARFQVGGDYQAKHWKLTPKSQYRSLEDLQPPLGLSPDDYFRFIPSYLGTVLPGKTLTWNTTCFTQNSATLTLDGNSTLTLSVTTSGHTSLCNDAYMLGFVENLDITFFEVPWWTHHIEWKGGWSDGVLYDIQNHGLRIFKFPDGIVATGDEIFETAMLFFGGLIGAHVPEWTAEDNIKFLKDHMNVDMPIRPIQRVDIPKSEIKSGDFLGVIRLDGLDPMLAWGMGSHTGHTTIAMWQNNELYICESTVDSAYWPNNGIQMTPYDEWITLAEKASYNVIHLPLNPDVAAKFNVAAAWKFFNSVKGLPYGFHNLFTGWVDTAEDNYPPPLTSHLAMLLAPFAEWLVSTEFSAGVTFDFLGQGLNFRLGTKNLTISEAYMEAHKRKISFTELVTMPEMDSWIFTDSNGVTGPSMVCDVFVMRMWKAGGIFGSLTDEIQAAEFTNWDAYTLNIFNANYTRPSQCVAADPDSQFCQVLGKYRMALPQYNSYAAFPNMRERCPSLPPSYIKPLNC